MGIRCGINNVRDLYLILKDMIETGKENYVICVKDSRGNNYSAGSAIVNEGSMTVDIE